MSTIDFRYLNNHTIYTCSLFSDKEMVSACFVSYFRDNNRENVPVKFKIVAYTDDTEAKKNKANYCLLSKEEIGEWLRFLKRFINFKYSIEERDSHSIYICLDTSESKITIKFLLTLVRYLYESPFNLILKDVFIARRLGLVKYSFIESFNLFCHIFPSWEWKGGHSHIESQHLHNKLTIKQLKERLHSAIRIYEVQKIYSLGTTISGLTSKDDIFAKVDVDSFFSEDKVRERFKKYYSKNIEIVKKYRKTK